MRMKSFTFGIGTGLLIACAIFYFAYGHQKNLWESERQMLIEKNSDEITQTVTNTPTATPTPTPTPTTANTVAPTDIPAITPEQTQEPTPVQTEEPTTALAETVAPMQTEEPTKAPAETVAPMQTEEPTKAPAETLEPEQEQETATEIPESEGAPVVMADGSIEVVIPYGSLGTDIAKILERNGIVDDYRDFLQYIINSSLTKKLRSGTFYLKKGMSFQEIASKITNK